ncbi:polyprotein [Horseradish latent virus]|uniref:Enzymatic polyprotein n=1 Tax=Horseradish latent virus TaxID=264076 RepID=Q5J1S1_9VIRU|nr:polyprotein [Horseradish latent virus]AAW56089.1 polyprotein [Horseradish latent virus]
MKPQPLKTMEHLLQKTQIQTEQVMNITNPNSIYIRGRLYFSGYKIVELDCFVDTGASLCIASKHVIPEERWEAAPRKINVKIANESTITLDKICRNLDIIIAGERFHIDVVFQQESGIDFIIGNNFCQEYSPFIQFTGHIVFTMKDQYQVPITKLRRAFKRGIPGFLESMKKRSTAQQPEPLNISTNKTVSLSRGRRFGEKLRITQERMVKIEELLEKVCSENPLDPEKSKGWMQASIKLSDPTKVIKVKPMKYSPMDREEFEKQIQELLDLKVIRPSKSPHMAPAFLVNNEAEKRRGKKRMVVNYKAMNDATVGDAYNLPNKDELLTLIRGKKIFSSFDCKSGFWQVRLDEESKSLTAFTCPQGHYEWNVVPFGMKQAPSIFQRHMDEAFKVFRKFCCIYVDDILVFSDNEQNHQLHVAMILQKCYQHGIILSKKKAQLFKERINFLGLEIDQGTHRPQSHILEHIQKFPDIIESKLQLQRFLGVLTYASDYIPKLAQIRKPLQAKLKENVQWRWTPEDTLYMKKVKKNLNGFPPLHHPLPEEKLIIETDASDNYWGGILKAIHIDLSTNESIELVCRYASGSFKPAEQNYHSNDKETLAVIRTIQKFSIYLTPVRFLVRTDNTHFKYFLNINYKGDSKMGRNIRWQGWLQNYVFDVDHIKGTNNCLADFLSREFNGA